MMITREHAYNIIHMLNEQAHVLAFEQWAEADAADDEEEAESLKDLAAEEQMEHFTDLFDALDSETRNDIFHYAKTDAEFGRDFVEWSWIDIGVE